MESSVKKPIKITSINQDAGEFAWKTLVLLGCCYALFLTGTILTLTGIIDLWLGFLINFTACYMVFTPMHEAAHSNISGRHKDLRWVDTVSGHLAASVLAAPFIGFERNHFSHHANTNIQGKDPDLWVDGRNPLSIALRCLSIYPLYIFNFIRSKDYSVRDKLEGSAILITIYAFVYWYGIHYSFLDILFLWIVPAIGSLGVLAFLFDWLPHYPFQETHVLKNTRNFHNPLLTFPLLYQNYHHIHHINPRIPFYKYIVSYKRIKELL